LDETRSVGFVRIDTSCLNTGASKKGKGKAKDVEARDPEQEGLEGREVFDIYMCDFLYLFPWMEADLGGV